MAVSEIPLAPENQAFSIAIAGTTFQMSVIWRAEFWCLDLMDGSGAMIIAGIPMITGYDLLTQYRHLNLGFSLYVICDVEGQENPTQSDLGTTSHLYAVTE